MLYILAWIWVCVGKQFNQSMPQPLTKHYRGSVREETMKEGRLLSLTFPFINYQISYELLFKKGDLDPTKRYDRSAYDNVGNSFCFLYPTDIEIEKLSHLRLQTKPLLLHWKEDKTGRLHIIGSDGKLHQFSYDSMNCQQIASFQIPNQIARFQGEEIKNTVKMVQINNKLFIFNRYSGYYLQPQEVIGQFKQMQGLEEGLQDVGIYDEKQFKFWVLDDNGISIYKFNSQYNLQLEGKYGNFSQSIISSVEVEKTVNKSDFYLLSVNKVYVLSIPASGNYSVVEYDFEGECRKLKKIKDVLYLMCSYDKINFITELKIGEKDLMINRYYDDNTLEGIKDVISLGYEKILLIGENQATIIGQSVNRKTLLDLQEMNKQQRSDTYYMSSSILQFINIGLEATMEKAGVLVISQKSIAVFRLKQNPPQVQCVAPQQLQFSEFYVTAVFNTSFCPQIPNKETSNMVCESWFPIFVHLNQLQVERNIAKLSIFAIVLLLIVLTLLCLGWCFTFRGKLNQLKKKALLKLEKLKEKSKLSKIQQKQEDDTMQKL